MEREVTEDDITGTSAEFEVEFEMQEGHQSVTYAVIGSILMECGSKYKLKPDLWMMYCSGMEKLLHLIQGTRPETYNFVHDLLCHRTMLSK